jgi:hypothetical protein
MASSWMLCRVALVRTDVSEELSSSLIRVIRAGELGTFPVTSNRRTLHDVVLKDKKKLEHKCKIYYAVNCKFGPCLTNESLFHEDEWESGCAD